MYADKFLNARSFIVGLGLVVLTTFAMPLRNHPKMIFRGQPLWPPKWHSSSNHDHALPGEDGVLAEVLPLDVSPPFCFWTGSESDGISFSALLTFEDEAFYKRILEVFKQHIGEPISKLGSVEIDF